jgi:hypothetical protein
MTQPRGKQRMTTRFRASSRLQAAALAIFGLCLLAGVVWAFLPTARCAKVQEEILLQGTYRLVPDRAGPAAIALCRKSQGRTVKTALEQPRKFN